MLSWIKSLLKIVSVFLCLLGVTMGVSFITLRILVPPEKIKVPCVVGKDLKEAILLLNERDLTLKVIDKNYSSKIPQDVIISQVPSPEVRVSKNREIKVVISEGTRLVDVLTLVGKKLIEAKIYLSQRGLKPGNITYVHADLPEEEVISQDPLPQAQMSREDEVNLLISLGQREGKFYMPDFTGDKIKRVRELTERVPLKIGRIKEIPYVGEEGVILSQLPICGSMVSEETLIEFEVSTSYNRSEQSTLQRKGWMFTSVSIPPGLGLRRIRVTTVDSEGIKTVDYGERKPGERIWIASMIAGKGEIRIYIEGKLVKVARVE